MADTTFVNGVTLTDEDWFNDVNRLHYTIFNDPANAIVALANLNAAPPGQGILLNGKVVTSVSSNALTIAIKGADGNDPSSTNPVSVAFRSSTLTESGFTIRKLTAALSVVVSSGSTLGHRSGAACSLFAYLINNAGTAELAVSSMPPDYAATFGANRLISTTAEGGAGGADSAAAVYSTTARSNVPWVCVAMIFSTQATAGTWASAMTQVDQAPFEIPKYAFRVHRNGSNQTGVATGTFTKFAPTTEAFDAGSAYDLSGDNRYECVVGGPHTFYFQQTPANPLDSMYISASIYVNGALVAEGGTRYSGTNNGDCARVSVAVNLNTGDYVEAYIYHGRGTNEDFTGTDTYMYFTGQRQ